MIAIEAKEETICLFGSASDFADNLKQTVLWSESTLL